MQDLWRLSATDLAGLIKSKKVSAKEAATAALARLDAVNPKLNAVVDHRPAEVLAEAAVVDAKIGRGEDPGVLAGVPVTVKVNIDQNGFATTNGLKIQKDAIAKDNSPVIDNLRKAGAIILGRTNCPAFSYRWFTTNLVHGSWNRSTLSGYKVVFVPFENGRPSGLARDILSGFLAPDERESYGRPVGVALGRDCSLLVADDVGDVIWRVTGA